MVCIELHVTIKFVKELQRVQKGIESSTLFQDF